jgi:predicted NBD/HSP70 family sugar kinase
MTDLRNGTNRDLLAGVDIGGSKIAVLVADTDLRVHGRHLARTEVGEPDRAAGQILDALDAALAGSGADLHDLVAVGVGVPGRVERATGTVSLAVNLGWQRLPLGALLGSRLGRPVRVENDVRAAAAGLHQRRVLGPVDDLAYLSIGTGISAGVVLDGRLHRGPRGMAGEIGHVVLDPAGPRCPCGLRGCFEALASGPAVAGQAARALAAGRTSTLRHVRPVTAIDVFEHAAAGDALALELVEAVGSWVARAVHELVMAYDVRRVALGGGVASAGETFLAPIVRGLDRLRDASPLAAEALPPDVVELLGAEAQTGTWGALILARTAWREVGRPAPVEEVVDA